MALTKKEKVFFRELDTTFRTPGWVRLAAGWKEELEAIPLNAFWNAKSMEELEAARIRYELLTSLVELPDHHDRARLERIRESDDGETDSV
jgi:hypothetical protein